MTRERKDKSCARVEQYTTGTVGNIERHNERKNGDYGNMNVDPKRIPLNIHFKSPGDKSYMDILREKEASGEISRRGLRADATVFDEMVLDINTVYFEEHGGYEFAKKFYTEAYRFAVSKYGEENIISAVMHADEINLAATEAYGKPVYHYHLHIMAFPVVEKQILWSKRCKDEALRGTVKETIRQISHAKKWPSRTPKLDENGNPMYTKNGKQIYRKSYSILQDEFFGHMTEHGFSGFTRGDLGSDAEHLTSMQYQIKKDSERLEDIEKKLKTEEIRYEVNHNIFKTHSEIDGMGKKTLLGSVTVSKDDFKTLTELAKEGIYSRTVINDNEKIIERLQDRYYRLSEAYDRLYERYEQLKEYCKSFLKAMELFPEKVKTFLKKLFEKQEIPKTTKAKIRAEKETAR